MNKQRKKGRRSIRLKGYNYKSAGSYFITICCREMAHRFAVVRASEMHLNDYGLAVLDVWESLFLRFPSLISDAFQIMPNHIHFILTLAPEQDGVEADISVSQVVGAFKSLSTKACRGIYKKRGMRIKKLFQRNYYEKIIPDEKAHKRIA